MEWQPEFDAAFAKGLIGKHILAGITDRERETDKITGHRQLHGVVVSADEQLGIVVRNPNTGSEFTLPPATNRFEPAEPAEYRLKSTGEVVTNPAYLCTWTVYGV